MLFVGFLGFGADFFLLGANPLGSPPGIPWATLAALAISGGSALWALQSGDQAVLSSCHARPADPADLKERQLLNVVDEMAVAAGIPPPKVYVVLDSDPNAFATGMDPAHASIAATEGLLAALNREELQGVIGHEMSHVRFNDIRLMTLIAALVGGAALLSDWARRSMRWGGLGGRSGRRSSGTGKGEGAGGLMIALLALWILAVVLAPIVSQILAMAVSRRREYLADAGSAELTRNPLSLAHALYKIEFANAPTTSIKRGTAHLCIADPMGRRMGAREGLVADLLATHPPMPRRIEALREMAHVAPGA